MSFKKVRIMGIDPGSRIAGFGVLDLTLDKVTHVAHGVISLEDEPSFQRRLAGLGESLDELLKKYSPQWVVVEKIFLSKNPQSAFVLGHSRGVVLAHIGAYGCEFAEYPPRVIKKSITGSGGGDKLEVAQVLKHILGISHFSHLDSSDALGLAWHQSQVLLEQYRQSKASLNL